MSDTTVFTVLKRIYRLLDSARSILVIIIFAFIITIGTIQIIMRYTPGINALSWVDEIMRYLNIWVVFLAAGIGAKNNSHLKVEYFLFKLFPDMIIPIVRRITYMFIIFSLLIVIYFGTLRVFDNLHAVIQSMPISISLFYAAIPVGSILMLLDYILIIIYGEHPFCAVDFDNKK